MDRNRVSFMLGRLGLAAAMLVMMAAPAAAQLPDIGKHPEIAKRRAAEKKTFTDAQIAEGFYKLTLGSELQLSGRSDRIRRFEVPVRVFIDNRGTPDRREQVEAVLADIGKRIEHLDIAIVPNSEAANFTITLVRDSELGKTIRERFGDKRASSILKSLDPQCLSSFRRDANFKIVGAEAILVTDAGDFVFYDCAYEELLQALGPINDDSSVRWSMFNDKVQFGFFDLYDQYILNLLYHPRMRSGMTRGQVRGLLPQIMPDVRSFVARTNNLPKP
jgi:hypothetical protein